MVKDHLGNTFKTEKDMCIYWNVSPGTYSARKFYKWNIKDCLLGRKRVVRKDIDVEKRTDPYGKVFPSAKAMCEHYGRSYRAYACGLTRGWSKEEALLGKEIVSRASKEDRTDHTGKTFDSIKLMCKEYGLDDSTYNNRIKDGWSKEKALTTPVFVPNTDCEDHLGNVFETETDMCRNYNISEGTYRARIRRGWSKEKALTHKVESVKIECEDHLGNKYKSRLEMCKAWGHKDTRTFDARIDKYGWTLEEALTGNRDFTNKPKKVKDHLGNSFLTKKSMCENWGVSVSSFDNRIASGWSLRKALTTKTKFKSYEYKGWKFLEPVYESPEGVIYYLCRKSDTEEVLSKEEIEEM